MDKTYCPLCAHRAKKTHQINQYIYYLCSRCMTLFLSPQPTQEQIKKYYKKEFNYEAGKTNEPAIRKRARIILQILKKLKPKGLSLLDIGSGYGYFVDEAYRAGLKVSAVEPSRSFHSMPIYRLMQKLHKKNFDEYLNIKSKNNYDFITLIHVLEHVSDPKKMISAACRLLSPNGILYIETPNLNSHLYRAEQNNYTFLTPPDHLWIFSSHSIGKMIPGKCGVVRTSTYSYPEHLMGILKSKFKKNSKPNLTDLTNLTDYSHQEILVNSILSKIKYFFFDRCIAPLFYRLLNIDYYGSILELYIKKK